MKSGSYWWPNPKSVWVADSGLKAIEGQYDTPLRLRQAPQPCRVVQGESDQCIIALQEIGDRPGRERQTTRDQRLMDSRHTGMVGIALRANEGEDIEAKLVLGQGEASFRFRPVRFLPLRTRRIEAAPHLEGEPQDRLQSRDGAVVVVGGPHGVTAAGTLTHNGLQGLREGGRRSGCRTGHRYHLHL